MKVYRSILSLSFALLVMVSGSNFMIGLHLCGGSIQNVALFSKADICPMEKNIPPCHQHEANSCCDNESISHDGQDFYSTITEVSFSAPVIIATVCPPILVAEIITDNAPSTNYNLYSPPIRAFDFTVSNQVFRI